MTKERVKPVSPEEIVEKDPDIPDEVFEAFNELLARQRGSDHVVILQEKVVQLIVSKGIDRGELFENHWLDIEGAYRRAGWKVEYDKPAYNETYEPKFIFRPKRKGSMQR